MRRGSRTACRTEGSTWSRPHVGATCGRVAGRRGRRAASSHVRGRGPHLRIVAVCDELRIGQVGDGGPPACCDELELAVAVELIPEEIAEKERLRPDAARNLRQRGFVDLEQPELGAPRPEQRRGDARDEIGPRMVVRDPDARAEDLRHHRRARRLAVRRRDHGGALGQPARQPVDRSGIELPEELSRKRRPAAAARSAGERPGGTRRRRLDGQGERRAHADGR